MTTEPSLDIADEVIAELESLLERLRRRREEQLEAIRAKRSE